MLVGLGHGLELYFTKGNFRTRLGNSSPEPDTKKGSTGITAWDRDSRERFRASELQTCMLQLRAAQHGTMFPIAMIACVLSRWFLLDGGMTNLPASSQTITGVLSLRMSGEDSSK